MLNEPVSIRPGEEIPLQKLMDYLTNHFPEPKSLPSLQQYPGGHSNLSYHLKWGNESWVLRRPPFGTKVKSAHNMAREFQILRALKSSFPYCPEALLLCEDDSIIGSSFYLMTPISGVIFRKEIPPECSMTKEKMAQCCYRLIDVFAQLHSIPLDSPQLSKLGKPLGYCERQLHGWTERLKNAKTPNSSNWDSIISWLQENKPSNLNKRKSIVHNDYKFDNIVWDTKTQSRIIGVLDWEMATLGDPLMDLGNSLAYWVEKDDPEPLQAIRMLPTHMPGALTRKQLVEYYRIQTNLDCENFNFFYVFGLFRLAGIVQQIYYRYYNGLTQDHRFKKLSQIESALQKASINAIEKPQF